MNANRRALVIVVIVVLVAAFAYPPFQYGGSSGRAFNAGYGWIFDPPVHGRAASVNIPMLIAEWVAVLLIGGLVWMVLGDTPKSSETGSAGKTTPEASLAQTRWFGLAMRLPRLPSSRVMTAIGKAALLAALFVLWFFAAVMSAQALRPWGAEDHAASQYVAVAAALQLAIAAPFLIGLRRAYLSKGGKLGALILVITTFFILLMCAYLFP